MSFVWQVPKTALETGQAELITETMFVITETMFADLVFADLVKFCNKYSLIPLLLSQERKGPKKGCQNMVEYLSAHLSRPFLGGLKNRILHFNCTMLDLVFSSPPPLQTIPSNIVSINQGEDPKHIEYPEDTTLYIVNLMIDSL